MASLDYDCKWACPKQNFAGSTFDTTLFSTHKRFTVKMQSLTVFWCAMLLLVEGPLGGTCEDIGPASSFECGPSDQGLACADGKRCCREGHRCSADSLWCFTPESVVLCGDSVSECPDDTTCCKTLQATWGCCPLPKAVCCEDKIHCCPAGSQCDIQQSMCVSLEDGKVTPMWDKLPARRRADWENQQANIACDDKVHCKAGTTCCKNTRGSWSCCPLPEAICCSDLKHCCPKGHTCNLAAQTCDLEWHSVPWLEKEAATPRQQEEGVKCDSTHTCADSSTCCRTKTGEWGCCPLPQAVCCADGNHCCPTDYICDEQEYRCVKKDMPVPWYFKFPSSASSAVLQQTLINPRKPRFVQCDDESECKDGETCCKISSTDWGCCPFTDAVCCPDMKHCCMAGYTCTGSGQCILVELP
ncbi:granulin a [Syngnathoides biaculeatus]|uniref:granulin a n=1 Tax=Syngnathoides biaculeatus TaxID=300417 RepID=UPI002ADE35E1|nr:granulin a [Syngnathoides biaculeatus]